MYISQLCLQKLLANLIQITFSYPSNPNQNVLNKSTFFFPAGESTFVVGQSGSGKSTLSNLLLKYYEPHSGEILVDRYSLEVLSNEWIRENITLVQQQSVLFNETILQNIAFGRSSHSTEEETWEAAKTADLEDTLSELADGLNTLVGSNGKSLSGGQQQRIAIARARLRDSPILILDEATSALDQRSREKVNNLIREWRNGKTTIIITHDISQILDTEYVYVLEHGVVVQEGYREKLAKNKQGPFASFLPVQNENTSQPRERRKPEPASPSSSLVETPDEVYPQGWKRISNVFGHETPHLGSGTFTGLPNRLSMGIGAAQTSSLRAEAIWSSPPAPDDGAKFPALSPKPPVRSPSVLKPPLRPLRTRSLVLDEKAVSETDIMSPLPAYTSPQIYAQSRHNQLATSAMVNVDPNIGRSTSRSPSPPPPPAGETEKTKLKSTTLRDILATVWPTLTWKQKIILMIGFVAAFAVGVSTPAFAYVFALLLRVYYSSGDVAEEARLYSLTMLAIAVVDGSSTFIFHYCFECCGQAWVNSLRVEAHKRVLMQPKAWFDKEKNSAGHLNEVLDRNAEEMRNLLGRFVGPVFVAFWMLSISVIWAFTISWSISLVALATAPVMYAATRVFNHVSYVWEEKSNFAADKASTIFTETFANIRVVRALTLERYFHEKHDKAASVTYKTGKVRSIYSGTLFGLADSMSYFISALVFYYSTLQFRQQGLAVDKVLQVIQLLMFGISNAIAVVYFVPQINTSRTTATQLLRLARLSLDSHETTGSRRIRSPFPIQMNNLSFAYASRPRPKALTNINLTIQAGTCTTIVGPSGSGKSTISSILLGLYPPGSKGTSDTAPSLTFNGVPIEHCNLYALRALISIVPQQPTLFPSTILSNITYGLPEDHPLATIASATQAAKDAGIHDFITSLENGYNTLIGEGGMGISGGQAQRIAIARALIRRPKLLILDEATSALDAISAEGIREMVVGLLKDKTRQITVVAISHGVEMMRVADEIVMVKGGMIVERGGFEELRRRGGEFSDLIGEKGI